MWFVAKRSGGGNINCSTRVYTGNLLASATARVLRALIFCNGTLIFSTLRVNCDSVKMAARSKSIWICNRRGCVSVSREQSPRLRAKRRARARTHTHFPSFLPRENRVSLRDTSLQYAGISNAWMRFTGKLARLFKPFHTLQPISQITPHAYPLLIRTDIPCQ